MEVIHVASRFLVRHLQVAVNQYFQGAGSNAMRAFDRRPEGGGFPLMHVGGVGQRPEPDPQRASPHSLTGGQAPPPPLAVPSGRGRGRGGGGAPAPPAEKPAPARGPPGRSNIANFSDLARRREEEEESKRGGNQGYFSGHGTGQAGTEIIDPEEQARQRLVDHARRMASDESGGDGASRPQAGRRLGDVNSIPVPAGGTKQKVGKVEIHLFTDGFTIGREGPLRRLSDPANERFLEQLYNGQVPTELEALTGASHVDVLFTQHEEKWTPAEKPKDAPKEFFSGQGRALGGSSSASGAASVPENILDPTAVIQVDESLTTSKIAIRFANGKRETVTVNPELHTIGDLKSYVSCVVDGAPFELIGPSNSPLVDDGLTISAASLGRALLHHKPL